MQKCAVQLSWLGGFPVTALPLISGLFPIMVNEDTVCDVNSFQSAEVNDSECGPSLLVLGAQSMCSAAVQVFCKHLRDAGWLPSFFPFLYPC